MSKLIRMVIVIENVICSQCGKGYLWTNNHGVCPRCGSREWHYDE